MKGKREVHEISAPVQSREEQVGRARRDATDQLEVLVEQEDGVLEAVPLDAPRVERKPAQDQKQNFVSRRPPLKRVTMRTRTSALDRQCQRWGP